MTRHESVRTRDHRRGFRIPPTRRSGDTNKQGRGPFGQVLRGGVPGSSRFISYFGTSHLSYLKTNPAGGGVRFIIKAHFRGCFTVEDGLETGIPELYEQRPQRLGIVASEQYKSSFRVTTAYHLGAQAFKSRL